MHRSDSWFVGFQWEADLYSGRIACRYRGDAAMMEEME